MQGLHDVSEKILHNLLIINVLERPTAVCAATLFLFFCISPRKSVVSLLPVSDK